LLSKLKQLFLSRQEPTASIWAANGEKLLGRLPSAEVSTARLVAACETPVGRSKIFNYYIWIFDFVRAVDSTSLVVSPSGQSRCPRPQQLRFVVLLGWVRASATTQERS